MKRPSQDEPIFFSLEKSALAVTLPISFWYCNKPIIAHFNKRSLWPPIYGMPRCDPFWMKRPVSSLSQQM